MILSTYILIENDTQKINNTSPKQFMHKDDVLQIFHDIFNEQAGDPDSIDRDGFRLLAVSETRTTEDSRPFMKTAGGIALVSILSYLGVMGLGWGLGWLLNEYYFKAKPWYVSR